MNLLGDNRDGLLKENGTLGEDLRQTIRNAMLFSEKKDHVLSLDEILNVEKLFYETENVLSLFGMTPQKFYEKGIRILGRTSIECTVDSHAMQIADIVKNVRMKHFPHIKPVVIDLFAGSGNLLFHIATALDAQKAIGIEKQQSLYDLTKKNFEIINFKCQMHCGDSLNKLQLLQIPETTPIAVILDPPWGVDFDLEKGLDLLKTEPSIDHLISAVKQEFNSHRVYFFIKIYEKMVKESLEYIRSLFSFSTCNIIECSGPRTGVLICMENE